MSGGHSPPAGPVRRWLRSVRPEQRHLRVDAVAGLPGAISSVPDGMASAVLVGVNPIHGLYASFAGPIAGGLSSSTRLMVITTTTAAALAAGSARVKDAGEIPRGLPVPQLPDLGQLSLPLVTGALAVAAIVLVQGSGVAEAAPNRDGTASNPNQDFIAQGAGNLAAGFFRGQPVGGSVGQTALNQTVGGRTRWAAICSGLWMLVILVAFSGLVGQVAMPTLAAVLIFAAAGSLRPGELKSILRTGATSKIAVVTTFGATLFLPVAAAVGIGVALSLLLQLNQEAMDLKVVELTPAGGGRWTEHPPPDRLTSHQAIVLDVYGSLLYAGSRTLQVRLPDPAGAEAPAVVLRLRGRTAVGATFVKVVADYAAALAAAGGRLYLSGVDPELAELLRRTDRVAVSGPVGVFEATELIGESTEQALNEAATWAIHHHGEVPGR